MTGIGLRGRRGAGVIGTIAAAIFCSGAVAAAASGATLKLQVTPGTIHKKTKFHVLITGTYSSTEVKHNGAYLLAFDQFGTTAPCKSTAAQEGKQSSASKFAHQGVGASPFGWDFSFTAGDPAVRRVCAYLFAKRNPRGTGTPLKRATITFRVR